MVTFRKNSEVSVETGTCEREGKSALWDPRFEVPRDNIMLCEILGEGAFGVVRKAVLTRGGRKEVVAVKALKGWHNLTCKVNAV